MPACASPLADYTKVKENERLHLNVIRVPKAVYCEAKEVLFRDDILAFEGSAGFKAFLLSGPRALGRAERLTKLAIAIAPKGNEAHFWNYALRELYLPGGSVAAPVPHFPALRMLQLYLGSGSLQFNEWEKWSDGFWI